MGNVTRDVIITGGGTAGHTNPGIAIGQALVAAGVQPDRVHFVGGQRGNERNSVPEAGFSIDTLPGRGITRSLSFQNIASALGLLKAFAQALLSLIRHRPRVVVCLGGYAAFPTSAAALLLRIPVVVSEQNSRSSAVNRLIGRGATKCALPFAETDLPRGVYTGNPIRSELVAAVQATDPKAARAQFDFQPERVVVAVWGGSLGATKINQAVRALAEKWADRGDVEIYHVVGRRDWEQFGPIPPSLQKSALRYHTIEYENNMPTLLRAANVAVCRSGASTVAELAVVGLPSVLVPLPYAPRDHQTGNAQQLVNVGAAILVPDGELTSDSLAQKLNEVVKDPDQRMVMADAARRVGRPDAADSVAQLVAEIGGIALR